MAQPRLLEQGGHPLGLLPQPVVGPGLVAGGCPGQQGRPRPEAPGGGLQKLYQGPCHGPPPACLSPQWAWAGPPARSLPRGPGG